MASVGSLERELSELRSEKRKKEALKKEAERLRDMAKSRRDYVNKLKRTLDGDFDNNVRSVNNEAEKSIDETQDGLKGTASVSQVRSAIESNLEEKVETDQNLSNALDELVDEYNELDAYYDERAAEVESYKRDILNLTYRIASTEAALSRAKAKEAAKRLLGG